MEFSVRTKARQQVVDITGNVKEALGRSGMTEGLCHVFIKHTSAAVLINENADPDIYDDLFKALNKAFPDNAGYKHDSVDGNAGAHIKATAIGPSESIPVRDGELQLGTWQGIMLAEFDGPRERTIHLTFLPAKERL